MKRPKRNVELEYDEDKGRWRASLAIFGPKRKNLLGYGTNVAKALVALSRAVERFAAEQLDLMLEPPKPVTLGGGGQVVLPEAGASAPKLCGRCGLVEAEAGDALCEPCRVLADAEVGGGG